MKGIVFTEFLEMVEAKFGYEMVDKILNESQLESNGAYTQVGTYSFGEMVQLITRLKHHTGIEVPVLLKAYGLYFFDFLKKNYPVFLNKEKSAFSFLNSIENHIHVEVKKLYPEAELPSFDVQTINPKQMEMVYRSERSMSAFAEGLIEKSLEYYKESGTISLEDISGDGKIVRFVICKN